MAKAVEDSRQTRLFLKDTFELKNLLEVRNYPQRNYLRFRQLQIRHAGVGESPAGGPEPPGRRHPSSVPIVIYSLFRVWADVGV